jgi:hypothetical protein
MIPACLAGLASPPSSLASQQTQEGRRKRSDLFDFLFSARASVLLLASGEEHTGNVSPFLFFLPSSLISPLHCPTPPLLPPISWLLHPAITNPVRPSVHPPPRHPSLPKFLK